MEVIIAIFAGVLTYHLGFDYFHLTDGVADTMGWLVGFLVLAGGPRFVNQIYKHWNTHIEHKKEHTRMMRQSIKDVQTQKIESRKGREKQAQAGEAQAEDYNFFK